MSAGVSTHGRAVRGRRVAATRAARALTAAEAAWLVVLPCALLLLAAIVVLGPPLGRALLAPPGGTTIWHQYDNAQIVRPEPTEHARYLIALTGPLLVAAATLALAGRHVRGDVARAATAAAHVVLLAFVVACITAQQLHLYGKGFVVGHEAPRRMVVLSIATLVVAVLLALLGACLLRSERISSRIAQALRETPRSRALALAAAALLVALWLLSAFNTDATIELANQSVSDNIAFWTDEAFAILNGHAPLVDFHAQYGQLWAYIAAGGLTLFGTSLGVYAAIMLAGTAGAVAAVLATLRRLVGGWPAAAALFAPFVATSFYMEAGPLSNRYSPANLFSVFPIRYAGPYVLLWLAVRRVQRRTATAPLALFTLAGLVAINNLEFGFPAGAATLVALGATGDRSRRALARLAGSALAGVALSLALTCALTLAVAGSLPHFGMLAAFPRIYGAEGFGLLPMPALGLHLVVYLTFAAALVVALLRAAAPSSDDAPALTAALAWAGLFGLGAGGYFVGRSHPHVLIDMFSAWALALELLLLVVVRAILRRPSRRPRLAELLVLAGIGAMACSLAQTPTPWSQIERLQRTRPTREQVAVLTTRVVDQMTHRGEPVALLMMLGHRIAYELGLDDVTPYANMGSMMTRKQWADAIAALRRAGGRRLIIPHETLFPELIAFLEAAGYTASREAAGLELIEFVSRP